MPQDQPSKTADPQPDAPATETPKSRFGRLRAWVSAHRFKTALAGLTLVSLVGALVLVQLYRSVPVEIPEIVTAEMALDALDRGDHAEAQRVAQAVRAQAACPPPQSSAAAFVLGTLAARDAEKLAEPDRKKLHLVASRYLAEAKVLGFPSGHEAQATLLLGKCLFGSAQIAASRMVLREALESNPASAGEIRYLLAAGFLQESEGLKDKSAKLAQALKENSQLLADSTLSSIRQQRALLQRAEILLNLNRPGSCRETLARIPATSKLLNEARVLSARTRIHEARTLKAARDAADRTKAAAVYQEAIQTLRQAQGDNDFTTPSAPKAMYLIGLCLLESGDPRAALNQFARTRMLYPRTPEALAADLYEAEIHHQQGRNSDAFAAYRRVLDAVSDPASYDNPWLPLESLRQRIVEGHQRYLDAKDYPSCLDLAKHLAPALPQPRAVLATAETHRVWGHDLLDQASQLENSKSEPLRRQARAHLRSAGQDFERLARLRIATREYPNDLWASANAYLEGHDYRSAVRAFQDFLNNEPRRFQAAALTGLGEALLASDRAEEAIAAFEKASKLYPRDMATSRARILAARAQVQRGNYGQAEAFLDENLNGEAITPDSKDWRESLFLMGELLHESGRYVDAIRRLDEALKRDQANPRYGSTQHALTARYLIADSHRQIAHLETQKLKQDLVEDARLARLKRIQEALATALEQYRQTQEAILRYQEEHELGPLEKTILRNVYFATGSLQFDLGQYEAALKTYSLVTSRYQNTPEVLDAYLQMARAHRQLKHEREANTALEQAKVVLNRMKPQTQFQNTTNCSRAQWVALLDQLTQKGPAPQLP